MSLNSALVVDDSKLARITLQRLLQKHNLSVDVAESGVIALEKLKSNRPDIIFMDHLMPDLDGFEATQKIKADPATNHIPVIMCTGKEDTDNYDDQARGIGASGTLSKPPQADQLALILAAAQTGEQLVTAAAAAGDSRPATTIEKSVADGQPAAHAELAKIFERLGRLEQTGNSLPSLDTLLERLSAAEGSLTTLQESVISLQNDSQEAQPLADEIKASVEKTLQSEFQQQLSALQDNQIDVGVIKSDLSEEFDAMFARHLEEMSVSTEAPEKIDEEALSAKILSQLEVSIDEKIQSSQSAGKVDEEALAGRLAGDIENTLMSLFAEELKTLEQKLAAATDDAISESRKDLDEHLQESVSKLALNSDAAAAPAEVFDSERFVNDPQFIALVTETVEAQVLAKNSSPAEDSAAHESESSEPGPLVNQQIESLLERVGELDRRQETIMDRLDAFKDQQASDGQGANHSGGLALGVIALAGAALAMAKAFGLF